MCWLGCGIGVIVMFDDNNVGIFWIVCWCVIYEKVMIVKLLG